MLLVLSCVLQCCLCSPVSFNVTCAFLCHSMSLVLSCVIQYHLCYPVSFNVTCVFLCHSLSLLLSGVIQCHLCFPVSFNIADKSTTIARLLLVSDTAVARINGVSMVIRVGESNSPGFYHFCGRQLM